MTLSHNTNRYSAENISGETNESCQRLFKSIDELGVLSGVDQHLNGPITSIQKLIESDHHLYVYTDQSHSNGGLGVVVRGYLKVGVKNLFFYVSTATNNSYASSSSSTATTSATTFATATSTATLCSFYGFMLKTSQGKVVEISNVPVCLDFYVRSDSQRCGVGKELFDYMLHVSALAYACNYSSILHCVYSKTNVGSNVVC